MDSDKLSLAHINAKKKERRAIKCTSYFTHVYFFVKYILVRKYILNYKLKK